MIIIKVFDFDNTIYRGESAVDLAFFMIKSNKRILFFVPTIFYNLIKYKLCLVDKDNMQKAINRCFKSAIKDKNGLLGPVESFWEKHSCKLDERMLKRIGKDDIIITATPDFLINGIKDRLNTSNIISSEVDAEKREVTYFNFGDNKVRKYKELYGGKKIDSFYTDSYNDKALMDISERVFIVKKGRIKCITK